MVDREYRNLTKREKQLAQFTVVTFSLLSYILTAPPEEIEAIVELGIASNRAKNLLIGGTYETSSVPSD